MGFKFGMVPPHLRWILSYLECLLLQHHHGQKASWGEKDVFGLHIFIIVHQWGKLEGKLKEGRNTEARVEAEVSYHLTGLLAGSLSLHS